jgi:ketosteroid isomerase-like protein
MPHNQNLDVIKRGYDAFGRGDINELLGLLDENIDWITPGPSDLPTAGHRHGRQEVAAFFQILNDIFQIELFTPRQFIAEGDRVVVTGDEVARIRSAGTTVEYVWAHVFELKDGRVVRFQEYGDMTRTVAAIRDAAAVGRA